MRGSGLNGGDFASCDRRTHLFFSSSVVDQVVLCYVRVVLFEEGLVLTLSDFSRFSFQCNVQCVRLPTAIITSPTQVECQPGDRDRSDEHPSNVRAGASPACKSPCSPGSNVSSCFERHATTVMELRISPWNLSEKLFRKRMTRTLFGMFSVLATTYDGAYSSRIVGRKGEPDNQRYQNSH